MTEAHVCRQLARSCYPAVHQPRVEPATSRSLFERTIVLSEYQTTSHFSECKTVKPDWVTTCPPKDESIYSVSDSARRISSACLEPFCPLCADCLGALWCFAPSERYLSRGLSSRTCYQSPASNGPFPSTFTQQLKINVVTHGTWNFYSKFTLLLS